MEAFRVAESRGMGLGTRGFDGSKGQGMADVEGELSSGFDVSGTP